MTGQSPDPMNLLARLEMLDGQYRQLRRIGAFALIIAVVLIVLLTVAVLRNQGLPEPAKDVVLRDDHGKRRAWLGMFEGAPRLEFYDENENPLGGMKMSKDESGFVLYDQAQKLRGSLGVVRGQPSLILFDENQKPRVKLTEAKGSAGLILEDDQGKSLAGLGVDKQGGHLILKDEKGKEIPLKPEKEPGKAGSP